MRFLVCFGDNDFRRELQAFGDLVVEMHKNGYRGLTQPWRIAELFNELAFGLHLMVSDNARAGSEKVRDYLKIKDSDVRVGQDAVDYMNDHASMWNHSWLFVDLNPHKSTAVIV